MKYDQLLMFASSIYKVSPKKLDALQGIFLVALMPTTLFIFIGFLLGIMPWSFSMKPALVVLMYGLAFASAAPFEVATNRIFLSKAPSNYLDICLSGSLSKYLLFSAWVVGVSLLALLPYMVYYMLILQGSESNILDAAGYLFLSLGLAAISYVFIKAMGVLVVAEKSADVNIFDMFKKTREHYLPLLIIIAAVLVPVELVAQIILYGMFGLLNISDLLIVKALIMLIAALIRAGALLVELYLIWTAVATYMKKEKLID